MLTYLKVLNNALGRIWQQVEEGGSHQALRQVTKYAYWPVYWHSPTDGDERAFMPVYEQVFTQIENSLFLTIEDTLDAHLS